MDATETGTGDASTGDAGTGDASTGDADGDGGPSTTGDGDGNSDGGGDGGGDGDGDGDSTTAGDGDGDGDVREPQLLLVGNSYTAGNDLAGLVTALGEGAGLSLEVASITAGGATVADMYANVAVQDALASEAWTHVLIQGQSLEPLWQPQVFHDSAVEFAAAVTGSGREAALFETWARDDGHPVYDEPWSGGTPEAMQALLLAGYTAAASDAGAGGAGVATVGEAWMQVRQQHPEIGLFTSDGSHRNLAGSTLAACVILHTFTATPCADSTFIPAGLDVATVDLLKSVADANATPLP